MSDVFPSGLSLDDALRVLLPVGIYVLAMATYAILVFRFYRFIANRDTVGFNLPTDNVSLLGGLFSLIGYIIRFVVLFPAFAFVWFATLTVMLALLAANRQLTDVLLIALVIVCAVRVCAYYDEDLARDVARILPFAVLSTFLVGTSSLDIPASLAILAGAGQQWEIIAYYWLFLVALELGLRLLFGIFRALFPNRNQD